MEKDNKEEICCPEFDPAPWDGKVLEWSDKRFVKGKVFTLFYVPVNFGGVISKMMASIGSSGVICQDYMSLSDHTSKWNMDIYVAVDKEVPGLDNVLLSGKFLSRVYEGDFKETEKWCNDFREYTKGKGVDIDKWYMWYTTCPKCAKKYGKNYVVIIAKIN